MGDLRVATGGDMSIESMILFECGIDGIEELEGAEEAELEVFRLEKFELVK